MAVTLANIETLVRYLLDDPSTSQKDIFTYENSSIFTLTEDNVISVSTLFINDVEQDTSLWSYDSDTGKVTVSTSMTTGDTVEINYTYYPNYSSSIVQNYVQGALVHISANNYKDFIVVSSTIYPEPTTREENLIATVASLLINPDNKSYRLPDVMVNVPSDLPTSEKIRRAIVIFKKDSHGWLIYLQ